MEHKTSILVLKLFAVLGLLGIMLGAFVMYQVWLVVSKLEPTAHTIPVGELGSSCGGEARLPCRPGLSCSNLVAGATSTGVCEKGASVSSQQSKFGVTDFRQLGETCGENFIFCAPGLYCKKLQTSSACSQIDVAAPQAISIKVVGAQPQQGVYRAPSDTPLLVVVQTRNAKTVEIKLEVKDGWTGSSLLLEATKHDGAGKYSARLTLRKGVAGVVGVTIKSKSGDTAYAAINVASSE